MASEKQASDHVERHDSIELAGQDLEGFSDVKTTAEARSAIEKEHNMTAMQALKLYPKAVAWSLLLSCAIIMEGYDVVLIGSFFGFPAFNMKYGHIMSDGEYGLAASWQTGMTNAMSVGQILGLFLNGIVSERYGYRKTLMACLATTVGFIFILFFAPNVQTLVAGEFLMGIPLGVYQTLTVTYACEVCPVALRAYLTTYVNLCWVFGQLIASGVLKGLVERTDQWGYRIPFAVQWVWPIPIFIGVYFAPESPWWLVRKDRREDAIKAVKRLTRADPNFSAEETVSMIVYTNAMEQRTENGATYLDCFKGTDLRRTEIACCVWAVQSLCGSGLMGYSTVFYQRAGLAESQSFTMSLAQYAIGVVGTFSSWLFMTYFGRRTLYVGGLSILGVILFIIGFVSIPPATDALSWATGSMLLVYTFIYDSTIGPVCFSLVSEMPSSRLRTKTVVLARNTYNILNLVTGIIIPYMLNVDEWNWKGKSGFFWGGMCVLCFVWSFFRLPEPKGRSYAELDVLFENKVRTREFPGAKTGLVQSELEGEKGSV
ncbi:Major facilitator superfamily domain general substrate transporter [Penicillium cf. griseofulvum]|uniref:Major facilitator superfamily domain general substrate transporter n=1 Tax=Penicillium cf. griseofulvum TaxID=2972120 RepID=A0A9W9T1I9_9EURO|nr:Major facilitator superfamily domain general substrate transporter [Penicillium cf. griseofulvum]KAJ5441148.1 Major facilitator superfamily domain general substrate transporter [Penicillium cf. griseofulvum]KAJ5449196.1 Major facilitator superfamily domain general substrate transporter [Penicillium cf. griseofulvum]